MFTYPETRLEDLMRAEGTTKVEISVDGRIVATAMVRFQTNDPFGQREFVEWTFDAWWRAVQAALSQPEGGDE